MIANQLVLVFVFITNYIGIPVLSCDYFEDFSLLNQWIRSMQRIPTYNYFPSENFGLSHFATHQRNKNIYSGLMGFPNLKFENKPSNLKLFYDNRLNIKKPKLIIKEVKEFVQEEAPMLNFKPNTLKIQETIPKVDLIMFELKKQPNKIEKNVPVPKEQQMKDASDKEKKPEVKNAKPIEKPKMEIVIKENVPKNDLKMLELKIKSNKNQTMLYVPKEQTMKDLSDKEKKPGVKNAEPIKKTEMENVKNDKMPENILKQMTKELEEMLKIEPKDKPQKEKQQKDNDKKDSAEEKKETSKPMTNQQMITPKKDDKKNNDNGSNEHKDHDDDKNIYYKFEYFVNDNNTKDVKHQREERKGDKVEGEYSLEEANGNIRTVKYNADWKNGFHAEVLNSKKSSSISVTTQV